MKFVKNMRTSAEVKLIYFQDPTLKGYFDKYLGRTVFHLPEKVVGNQYLDVLRILVPPQITVSLHLSSKFDNYCQRKSDLFPGSYT